MHDRELNVHSTCDARAWSAILAKYREPRIARSVSEIAITAVPLVLLWILMWSLLDASYWLCLVMAVPAAGLLIRLFIIQHDCGHGSFFRHRPVNDWVGRAIGVLTLTPYDIWRRSHAIHHATSGNLARRGVGDIDTLTVGEYLTLPRRRRFLYRLYRHPIVMFGVGPAYFFLVRQRVPIGEPPEGRHRWLSAMATNAAIALLVAAMIWLVGVGPFLRVQVPILGVAFPIGGWMFYIQHQFEDTSWAPEEDWTFHQAALHGSSYYDLPVVLRWFTANIGVHHVHHLCSRIPFYRLSEVLRDHPRLAAMGRLTLWQSLKCVHLALWDPTRRRLVAFREVHALAAATTE